MNYTDVTAHLSNQGLTQLLPTINKTLCVKMDCFELKSWTFNHRHHTRKDSETKLDMGRRVYLKPSFPMTPSFSALSYATKKLLDLGTFPNDWLDQSEASVSKQEKFSQSLHIYMPDMGWRLASRVTCPVIAP
ncbi:hypothetical protein TNCV_2540521 [Trichonephila clavipes]|nr:hypothetical protein TNCV_2540521 [Trichonephila clavipes]